MSFATLPIRSNGKKVDSSWWNSIRTAGILLETLVAAISGGGGSLVEVFVSIANNQSSPTNITGLVASSLYRVTRVKYWVRRVATDNVMECGELVILYNGTVFAIGRSNTVETSITSGMSFDIDTATGQVKYTSSNMAGTYDTTNSKMGYTTSTQGTI